jgi:hypothetical protein
MTQLKVKNFNRKTQALIDLHGLDVFHIFNLPKTLPIDQDQLNKTYNDLIINNHPDNFFDQDLSLAQRNTEIINQGYKNLQNYSTTLKLFLGDFEAEQIDDPEPLMEIFTLKESFNEGQEEVASIIEIKIQSLIVEIQDAINNNNYLAAKKLAKLFLILNKK